MPRFLDELEINIDLDEGDFDIDVGLSGDYSADIDIGLMTGDVDIDFGIGDEEESTLLSVDEIVSELEGDLFSLDVDFGSDTLSVEEEEGEVSSETLLEVLEDAESDTELEVMDTLDTDFNTLDDTADEGFSPTGFIDIDIPAGEYANPFDTPDFELRPLLDFEDDADLIFNRKRAFGL